MPLSKGEDEEEIHYSSPPPKHMHTKTNTDAHTHSRIGPHYFLISITGRKWGVAGSIVRLLMSALPFITHMVHVPTHTHARTHACWSCTHTYRHLVFLQRQHNWKKHCHCGRWRCSSPKWAAASWTRALKATVWTARLKCGMTSSG